MLHRAAPLQPLAGNGAHRGDGRAPPPAAADPQYPFMLIPAVSASLRDGRPANLPWLQESPGSADHAWSGIAGRSFIRAPRKAMEISEGDVLLITSAHGSIRVKAYLMPGIHPGRWRCHRPGA